MEHTPWKLSHGTYTIEVTSWNLHDGSYLVEHTPWKLNVEAVQVNVDHLLSRGLDIYYIKTLHSPLFSRLLFRLFVFLLILANLILVFVYFSVSLM